MTPQWQTALDRANQVRLERARIRADIADGALDARELILDPPAVLTGVALGDFLSWMPRFGRSRVRRILVASSPDQRKMVSETITLGALSERTRQAVAGQVPAPTPVSTRRAA